MRMFILISLFLSTYAQAQHADVFFAVHCEPHNDSLFYKLTELVDLADNYNIPLTIELTPQWAERISSLPPELNILRMWQLNGHEIGAHHHGVEAGNGWDGYTDHPPEDWPDPSSHLGSMNDYIEILNLAAGDSLVLTGGFGDSLDWHPGMLYRTIGHTLDDAVSQPELKHFNGHTAWDLSYSFVYDTLRANLLISLFNTTGPDDIFGIVTHVFNFRDDELYLRMLFEFFQNTNPGTVRSIMRSRGLIVNTSSSPNNIPDNFKLYQNYPNPFNPATTIEYCIPVNSQQYQSSTKSNGELVMVQLKVYNILGKELATLVNEHQPPGRYEVKFIANNIPSGVYFYILTAGRYTDVKKMVLLR